jgi:integrase
MTDIRTSHIAAWKRGRVAEGRAPTTIKNALTIVSQVYATARSEWGADDLVNPVRGVKMPKNRRGRTRRFKDKNEEEKLYQACDASSAKWLGPLVRLAVQTAMRLGELLALSRGNIIQTLQDGKLVPVIHLPETKNDRERSVPLFPEALTIIQQLTPGNGGRFFPVTVVQVENAWRAARKVAEMEDFRFHDLRHEGTSRLFERGLDAIEVATVTGHQTDHMLRRYTHFPAAKIALKLAEKPAAPAAATRRKKTRGAR